MDGDQELPSTDSPAAPREARPSGGLHPGSAADSTPRGRRAAPVLPRSVLEALPDRHPDALEAFYSAYFDRIYGYVRRLLRDEHTSEDLTQDIFMHIHRALPSYDPARDLRPWVFTIATNKLRDFWQSRRFQDGRRQVSLDDEDAAPLAPASEDDAPSDALDSAELGEAVAEAIERLPEGLRVTFWLRWHEELSFEEIAAQIDRTEVAVRKRYSRALGELRRLLGDRLLEPGGEPA